jgi:hypothetical protein
MRAAAAIIDGTTVKATVKISSLAAVRSENAPISS